MTNEEREALQHVKTTHLEAQIIKERNEALLQALDAATPALLEGERPEGWDDITTTATIAPGEIVIGYEWCEWWSGSIGCPHCRLDDIVRNPCRYCEWRHYPRECMKGLRTSGVQAVFCSFASFNGVALHHIDSADLVVGLRLASNGEYLFHRRGMPADPCDIDRIRLFLAGHIEWADSVLAKGKNHGTEPSHQD